jgi:integrase
MEQIDPIPPAEPAAERPIPSNVKSPAKSPAYERFGETIRYLTIEEWQQLLDGIEDYRHKLMIRIIYELGCRVGEFVRIQLRHVSFGRNSVYFPAENTKTRQRRVSHLPAGIMNEIKSMLRREGRMAQRSEKIHAPGEFLFYPFSDPRHRYTENRLRQIFAQYVQLAGLDRQYGRDRRGRALHELTIHSLRHSHIMHYVHEYKLPLPIVQKQVGHKSLKTTSVYLRPSDEHVGQAYAEARTRPLPHRMSRLVPRRPPPPKGLNSPDALSFHNDSR